MADINAIATQFTAFYYQSFDADRASLLPLYRTQSMLTFEGSQIQGAPAIIEKLTSLPFQKVVHKITTQDAQPADPKQAVASLIVSVTGELIVDDGANPMKFSQTFQLVPDDTNPGQYYVFNDIFRLNYG